MNKQPSTAARVTLIGAGGLGVAIAHALAEQEEVALRLRIIDFDSVERSNFNRQYAYTESDCGRPKAAVLLHWLQQGFAERCRTWEAVQARVEPDSAAALLGDADLLIDASDSAATKFMLNDFAIDRGIALCHGAASGNRGQALLVLPQPGNPCLRCIFGDGEGSEANCQSAGILGAFVGAIALLQTELALAFLSGRSDTRLYSLELSPLRQRAMQFPPATDCRCQGELAERNEARHAASPAAAEPSAAPSGCPAKHREAKRLDLSDKRCPETFLFTKLAVEQSDPGTVLEVLFSDAETREQVRASLALEGIRAVPGGDTEQFVLALRVSNDKQH